MREESALSTTHARLIAAAASLMLSAAAPPQTADFANAAEFATALVADNGPPTVRDLEIVTGSPEPQRVTMADYRTQRIECELSRLVRIEGLSDIGIEWRCGPLRARVNDVYRIGVRGVARILVNVPFFVTAPPGRSEPR